MTAEILRIDPDEPEPALISRVVRSLAAGNVAALPTDTFYGLAVDPVNLRAVDRIYEIKTRARHKPLSLLIAETAQAYGLAREIDTAFDRLAERFWPGPLTICLLYTSVVQRLFALRRKCKRGSSIFFRSSVERECSES